MTGPDDRAASFEAERPRLAAMARRMLGSRAEAEDAVQEAWLRLARAEAGGIDNLAGWLTTVTARLCLDALRARRARAEAPLDLAPEAPADRGVDLEMADSVGLALLVVLEALAPAERVAFVLHDLFDLPFVEVGRILDRSPEAARQLASRARRRVRGAPPPEAGRAFPLPTDDSPSSAACTVAADALYAIPAVVCPPPIGAA